MLIHLRLSRHSLTFSRHFLKEVIGSSLHIIIIPVSDNISTGFKRSIKKNCQYILTLSILKKFTIMNSSKFLLLAELRSLNFHQRKAIK